jgi:hypothetical protein
MSHNFQGSQLDLGRFHNPWEKFEHRDEKGQRAESDLVFRLGYPLLQVNTLFTRSTAEVVESFLSFGSNSLDDPVPRKRQLLRDFLQASHPPMPTLSSSRSPAAYLDEIRLLSAVGDIALVDDRNYHPDCARKIGRSCSGCYIYSEKLSIPDLCTRLQGEVGFVTFRARAETRLTYIRACSERHHTVRLIEGSGKFGS